jgi:hypothetical protein
MGVRRIRKDRIAADQKVSRRENGVLKVKERARRDARMLGVVQAKKLPYLPSVMSWLSAKLDKPSRLIAQTEVDELVASAK